MKLLSIILFSTVTLTSLCQSLDTVEVSNNKTTYILMENDINLVDIGSRDYVSLTKENMVILKATKENALPTSLMIRTKSSVSVWIIKFAKDPKSILISKQPEMTSNSNNPISEKEQQKTVERVQPKPVGEGFVSAENYAQKNESRYGKEVMPDFVDSRVRSGNRSFESKDEITTKKMYKILREKRSIRDVGEFNNGIYFMLYDVFVDREQIYVKIAINNTSSIAFDIDYMSFDRSQGKTIKRKEAVSKQSLTVSGYEAVTTVAPMTEEVIVYAVKLFAFQENDALQVKLSEMGGVRTLKFGIPAKIINNAKSL